MSIGHAHAKLESKQNGTATIMSEMSGNGQGRTTTKPFSLDRFFDAVVSQNATKLASLFEVDATIIWANTDEQFSVAEYVRATCEYPGNWQGVIEKVSVEPVADGKKRVTAIAKVTNDSGNSFRAVSFFEISRAGLIQTLTEYWGDITQAPKWRQDLHIGKRIETSLTEA